MIDMRDGEFVFVQAKAVLLATGGGPTMYKFHTPSGDKTCDGLAMALRAGLPLRDMEMVQFHPTGLLAGTHTRMTGTVLEEGLRGAGGYLLDGAGERFMHELRSARRARHARHRLARHLCRDARRDAPRRTAASSCDVRTSAPDNVRRQFKGMVERCADCGFDLAGGRVEVVPTAHYMMGGVEFAADCTHGAARTVRGRRGHRAACTAPTGWAATASPTRRCSAASPATRMAAWLGREGDFRAADTLADRRSMARAERRSARAPRQPRSDSRATVRNHVGRRGHRARRRQSCAGRPVRWTSLGRELADYAFPTLPATAPST